MTDDDGPALTDEAPPPAYPTRIVDAADPLAALSPGTALTDAGGPARRRHGSGYKVAMSLLVVIALGLVAVSALFGLKVNAHANTTAARQAALSAARQMAVDFTTINYQELDKDVKAVLEDATGDFKSQYTTQSDQIRSLVTESKVESTGEALDAGLASFSPEKATALVILDSTVKNAQQPKGNTVRYRLKIELKKVDGQWLTSDVAFVA